MPTRSSSVRWRLARFVPFSYLNVPAALQAGCGAACDQDRKVFVIVKAGITHAAAVQVDRVIEERAVAIGSGLHSLEEL